MLDYIDDFNLEVLHIETDFSLPALRLIGVLEYLSESRGLPKMFRVENDPEFIPHKLDLWCRQHNIDLAFIQPCKPRLEGLNDFSEQKISCGMAITVEAPKVKDLYD